MFFHNHHRERGCGPQRGSWRRGPFEVSWEISGGRGDGRQRRRRMFDGDELRLILLALIGDTPRHGYDLIREIEERTGGAYVPSPGVVYPTLTMLADMGQIEERESEGARKLYGITAAGAEHLKENIEQVALLMGRLAELGNMRERTDGGPVRRAMGNLKTVLRERVTREEADAETLHQVAAIIDEAAQRIERL